MSSILILQSGLRNVSVGADTLSYYNSFEMVKHMDWSSVFKSISNYYIEGIGKDPGYLVLQKLVQYFTGNYQVFLILIAVFFFTALSNFIAKNTIGLWDTMFAFVLYSSLFYAFFSITGHRQTISTAMALFGFNFIKQRRFLYFLVLITIASTIHRSCLVFLPFYFLYNLNGRIFFPIALLVFPIMMYYREEISEIVKNISGYENYGIYAGAGTYTFTAMLMLVSVLAWWRMKYVIFENKNAIPLFNALVIALILTPLTWVNPSAMRAVQYYSIYLLVLIPHVINSLPCHNVNFRKIGYVVAIVGLIILSIQAEWNSAYRFFWQPMELESR